MSADLSLQGRYAPHNRCFGCGPANDRGLRIKSYAAGDELVAEWAPERHPWPMSSHGPLRLCARVVEAHQDRAIVDATLEAGGRMTAYCRVTFVAVQEGHPAYH